MPRELQDVVRALAQRRHANVHAAQPVEEVGAKAFPLDALAKTAVGGGDDPDVDAVRPVAADTLDRKILNRAQKLCLGGRRQIRHLVEEQGSARRRLELAAAAFDAGGDPILDAEQLRFDERFDERRAIDRDKRPGPAAAAIVNLPRDQLFSDAALAR
ncbi:MAG TPA: hypothetical protein VKH42_07015 [Vicinamibacterales bacterium]|nr:hypothetical protein [Vicinamibacterales bacterium]